MGRSGQAVIRFSVGRATQSGGRHLPRLQRGSHFFYNAYPGLEDTPWARNMSPLRSLLTEGETEGGSGAGVGVGGELATVVCDN
jgi:hypothetical protein